MVITGTKGVVVGRVVRVRPHPDGDHIWLADLDIGTDGEPQIVWGGVQIVEEGDLVPVARPGAWLPATKDKRGPYKIRRRHYRGEQSEGKYRKIPWWAVRSGRGGRWLRRLPCPVS